MTSVMTDIAASPWSGAKEVGDETKTKLIKGVRKILSNSCSTKLLCTEYAFWIFCYWICNYIWSQKSEFAQFRNDLKN